MASDKARELWRKAELAINEAICGTQRGDLTDYGWAKASIVQRQVEQIVEELS